MYRPTYARQKSAMATMHPRASMLSVDITPEQQEFLNQPSPYHDNFPDTLNDDPLPSTPSKSKGTGPMFDFLKRFKYTRLEPPRTVDGPERRASESGERGSNESFTPFSHEKPSDDEVGDEKPSDRWFTILFLLLLMSVLFNLFLYFNGPPSPSQGALAHHAHKNYKPHGSFTYRDHGHNYTCYKTHNTVFEANFDYSDTYHTHDHLWLAAQGGSQGTVYTSQNRDDGSVRAAGISMFHQLHCLAQIRGAIQQLQDGKKIGFSEQTDISEHKGHWPHCFDYLRQAILCNADDSVEISGVHNGQWSFSGYGSNRVCRDSTWLYEATACGEAGCEGTVFYHDEEEMSKIHQAERKAVEDWHVEHDGHSVGRRGIGELVWGQWLRP